MIKKVAFFGYADAKPKSKLYQEAFATAKLLARHGYTIVNGGGPGVMDASTQGAVAGGGDTIAVTFNPQDAPGFEGRYVRNIVDKEIFCDTKNNRGNNVRSRDRSSREEF